ncbi:MAG: hypothetical protein IT370_05945 [Deltaproteobacteria bacterium]|nr:hypothetical protein [Deltaproteobacteria bacterium]
MSEKDKDQTPDHHLDPAKEVEPEAGTGSRSLANWQNLAKVRQSLAADKGNQSEYELDPAGYMQRFGVDVGSVSHAGQAPSYGKIERLEGQSAESPDMQLAFCKVWGFVIVVAAGAANGVALANAAANANALANANAAANVNGVGPADEG